MGEVIGEHSQNLTAKKWVLIAHGDRTGGLKIPNPYEEGIYMSLTEARH